MSVIGPWMEHLTCDEGLTRQQAEEMLVGWELIPCEFDGRHMATLIKKNAEVHFAIYKEYQKRYMTARRLRAFLLPILESEGFLVTKLGKDDKTERFITRLGFVEMGSDSAGTRTFMLTDIKPLEKT
jgi:hypothetical protein